MYTEHQGRTHPTRYKRICKLKLDLTADAEYIANLVISTCRFNRATVQLITCICYVSTFFLTDIISHDRLKLVKFIPRKMNCWVYATAEPTSELHACDGVHSALTDATNTALVVLLYVCCQFHRHSL